MAKRFMLDCGNSDVKSGLSQAGGNEMYFDSFPHVLYRINDGDYQKLVDRKDASVLQDVYLVNEVPYQIGKGAERRDFKVVKKGAARYEPDYYGVLMAISFARGFKRSAKDVVLVASHPPRDAMYIRNIANAAMAYTWQVVNQNKTFEYRVNEVYTVDEPTCGYMCRVLRKQGGFTADKTILAGSTLVIDIGGFTTDIIVFDEGGKPDVGTANSQELGVLKAVQNFENEFRRANSELMRGVKLSLKQLHDGFRYGKMSLKGLTPEPVDCQSIAREYAMELVNAVIGFYQEFGGSAMYDTVLLTGGGSALLYDYLVEGLQHNNVLLAGKRDTLQLANTEGGIKWLEMMMKLHRA